MTVVTSHRGRRAEVTPWRRHRTADERDEAGCARRSPYQLPGISNGAEALRHHLANATINAESDGAVASPHRVIVNAAASGVAVEAGMKCMAWRSTMVAAW